MFELTVQDGEIKIAGEKHYRLISDTEIKSESLQAYSLRAG